ncbi:MAG: hypothetical protein R6X06_03575 [Gammaproteobacteria bacterium]
MHPVIRIGTFILLAVLLARAQPMQMGWVLCVIGLAFVLARGRGFGAAVNLMWRIRWIVLSILLLYTWLPLGDLTTSWWLAVHRIALLLLMLLALQALVLNMARNDIISGLYRVLAPLAFLGLPREKFVLRLMLTLECVAHLPALLQQDASPDTTRRSPLRQISARLMHAIAGVLAQGETLQHAAVTIETDVAVPWWQWTIPLSIAVIFFSLPMIG